MSDENFIEALISAVKVTRILWDMSHKHYHNRLFVDKEWTRIASDLGETKDAVKAKWKNLPDNFRKEYKKIPKCRTGDDNEQAPLYQGSWVHFDSLLFLKSVFTPRNTQSNIERPENSSHSQLLEDQQDASQSQDATISQNEDRTQSEDSQQLNSHKRRKLQREIDNLENELPDKNEPVKPIEITKKRKIQCNYSTNFEQEMLSIERKKIELLNQGNIEDDEDINFFKSLLPHVRLLPPLNKLAFRSAVQNLLANEIIKVQTRENIAQQVQTTIQHDDAGSSYVSSPYPSPAATFISSASDISQHPNQPQYDDRCFLTLP